MIKLSATMIKDALTCSRIPYYRINQPEESVVSYKVTAGSIVHDVVRTNWKDYRTAFAEAERLIKRYNLKQGIDIVLKCLENFFVAYQPLLAEDDIVERLFSTPWEDGVELVGKMDRIHNGIVYDWKTGEYSPSNLNVDPQFIVYYLAYKRLYNKEPRGLVYVDLAKRKIIEYEPVPFIINTFVDTIIPQVITILRTKKYEPTGLFKFMACDRCFFVNTCHKDLNIE